MSSRQAATPNQPENQLADQLEQASQPYLGQWNLLVSTTNWEKGRIISEWRQALRSARTPSAEYSDEAWSRRVGQVSPQHVGRLRRVYDRFGSVREGYASLYWSHFHGALDWEDAELWLEGALQNGWSVSEMRRQRWEALGAPAELKPRDEDIISGELDEDFLMSGPTANEVLSASTAVVQPTRDEADDEDRQRDSSRDDQPLAAADSEQWSEPEHGSTSAPPAEQPLANLPELPEDLAAAFDAFKLAILRHKLSDWQEVPRDHVLFSLDALRRLTLSATE